MSLAGDIRQAAKHLDGFSPKQMHKVVGGNYGSVCKTLRTLVKAGYLKKRCFGVYEMNGNWPKTEASPGQKKLWRLMKMMPRFTVVELARLAELNQKYTRAYFTFLKKEDHIKRVGRERHPNGKNFVQVYALSAKNRNEPAPPYRKPRPAIEERERWREKSMDTALKVIADIREDAPWEQVRETILQLEAQVNLARSIERV